MHKIMVVEDEPAIRDGLCHILEKWHYQVLAVTTFETILEQFHQFNPHLLILDVMLPFFNGYHWCAEIRKVSQVPILFVSSRNQSMDIVMGMNLGADDYMTKPFDENILIAKVQSLLRRSYEFTSVSDVIDYKGVSLDLRSAQLYYQGQHMSLTKNEFVILQVLFERRQSIVSRDDLMRALWQNELFIDDNTLSVNIARLRKKLSENNLAWLIVTKKGLGYGVVDE